MAGEQRSDAYADIWADAEIGSSLRPRDDGEA